MRTLRSCVERLYLEVFPTDGIEELLTGMPDGAHIGITCSPRQGLDVTLDLVGRLQGHDFQIVPHIAARQVRDAQHLRDLVQRLSEQNVRGVFVPGGDVPQPVGQFDSALMLLRELANIGHNFEYIGVAAHPEGHPELDDSALLEALKMKQELSTYMVTQMCFDANVVATWVRTMRARGITLPIWIGLPGVLNRIKLFNMSMRIGVGESARFARKQKKLAGKLLRSASYTPDDLVFGLEPCIEDPACGIEGFYLFSFNQVRETTCWREKLLERLIQDSRALNVR